MPTQKKVYSYKRFSSKAQAKGDSLKRQTEKAQEYADKNSMVLDTTQRMDDLGKSGYFGEHVKQGGALAGFLQLVKDGSIAKGSILVVEALDRLSRQKLSKALSQFMSILDAGITIVTTTDNQVYKPDGDDNDIIKSVYIMVGVHKESALKQERLNYTWKQRRENASIKKIATTGPKYLILNKEENRFEFKSGAVEKLEYIIKLYLSGMGTAQVAKTLNKEGIASFGERSKTWNQRYIIKLLRNKALIGLFQPKKYNGDNDERELVPTGEPIVDYFPRVIDDDTFYKIQKTIGSRKLQFNKKGKYTNLFSHIARCGYCGSKMHIMDSGAKKRKSGIKDGKYLACSHAKKGANCINTRLRYTEFELSFLKVCKQLSIRDLIEDTLSDTTIKINTLTDNINTIEHKLIESSTKIDKIWNVFLGDDEPEQKSDIDLQELAKERLRKEMINKTELEQSLEEKKEALQHLTQREDTTGTQLKNLKDNIIILQNAEGEELWNIRMKVHHKLLELIDHIFVYTIGTASLPENAFTWKQPQIRNYTRDNKCFGVKFADGGWISCRYDKDTEEYKPVYETDDIHNWSKIPDETFTDIVKSFQRNERKIIIGKPLSFLTKGK